MRSRYLLLLMAIWFAANLLKVRAAEAVAETIPGEFLVKYESRRATSLQALTKKLEQKLGVGSVAEVRELKSDQDIQVIKMKDPSLTQIAMETLRATKGVLHVEPQYIYRTQAEGDGSTWFADLVNDPSVTKQWAIKNEGQADANGQLGIPGVDLGVLHVWRKGIMGDKRIVVAVIDTGVDYNHPDLKANIFTNPGEIPGNGIDDDHNGFIDDVHGWNFQSHTNDPLDDHDHGSHCSGVIGAEGNNAQGVTGLNHQVSILPVKFLGPSGGSTEGAIESINYATMMKVNIMSNSWGGGGASELLKEAIAKARDQGILFVVAAGNSHANNETASFYPANYDVDNVLSVAATDNRDQLASFSNYGAKKVHVAAPGVKIFSTVKNGGYDQMSGTSMATPQVAGIAALMLSRKPHLTYQELKQRLIDTSVPVSGLKGKVQAAGRVSAYNAVFNLVIPQEVIKESDWVTYPLHLESPHPYENGTGNGGVVFSAEIKSPVKARHIRVHFKKVATEDGYDYVTLTSGKSSLASYSGSSEGFYSDDIELDPSSNDALMVNIFADTSTNGFGFEIDQIQVIP